MPQTILTGFEIKAGSFPSKDTGELVEYSKRIIYFITDLGVDDSHIGFSPFDETLKRTVLAQMLKVPDDEKSVNERLKSLINKPVEIQYAPRNGELAVVGLRALQ